MSAEISKLGFFKKKAVVENGDVRGMDG